MRNIVVAVSVAAVAVLTIAYQVIDVRPATTRHVVNRPSQERLDQIRRSLVAQIAVQDQAERAMRAPTDVEAAALSNAATETLQSVALPGGGVALRTGSTQLSLVVATRGEDGTIRLAHGDTPVITSVAIVKGGRHAR